MYNHKQIEKYWQEYWEENKTFKTSNDFSKPKFYTLDMFPYPSGAGLHVGHPKGYTANDIISRYKNASGFNVLHPMGWDAFGLPAENYAIKTGTHPSITIKNNIETFKSQIKALGFSYDWDKEIDTTNPKYYKWTQFIFAKMFEAGLAYEQDLPINFCPSCKTGLANEEVLNNGSCERCGAQVEKRKLRQWVLAITKYADRLEKDIDSVDWPEGIKDMQKKWIGRSEGVEFKLKKYGDEEKNISVYTTRLDTVFGMTYAVIAPDHKDINDFINLEQKEVCEKYIKTSKNKSDLDRTGSKEKTGVFTGSYVINPFNKEKIPVYIGDYVLGNYGTGAVMAVPAHDERDFEFAKKMEIKIKEVISGGKEIPFTSDGILINSGEFNGLTSKKAREELLNFAIEKGFGEKKVNYKLRDWLFSRQRYWGEPIPLIHLKKEDIKGLKRIYDLNDCPLDNNAYVLKTKVDSFLEEEKKIEFGSEACLSEASSTARNSNSFSGNNEIDKRVLCSKGEIKDLVINKKIVSRIYSGLYSDIIIDWNLPLKLPNVENFEPSSDGNSPLSRVDDFVNISLAPNLSGKRETNTMPQWGGSCWYYLRFQDRENENMLVGKEAQKYWGSVDSYVGGAEHAVLHLLYARFWHKFLYDIGIVSTKEPFAKLRNQGLVLAYAYEDENGGLIASDLVFEENGKFFHKETKKEVKQVIAKMSKSLKNVVNPNDIVEEFGADSLRLYEMSLGDFKDSSPWDTKNIIGVKRFLDKVWDLFEKDRFGENDETAMKNMHKTIKKVGEDIENYKFNTAISSLIILVNYGTPKDEDKKNLWLKNLLIILHPFAPHLAEELYKKLGNKESIYLASWPKYDENMTIDNEVVIGIQVLGKLRGELKISLDENKDEILKKAKEIESVTKWLEGKEIVKEIYVPGKIINIVVK
ncbi:leucine--tRNA ligase [Candidatus Gracilibacteria bacterium]|nr:leucine--tRNA ligase [Candidatus Gracilibacteria bacterium]